MPRSDIRNAQPPAGAPSDPSQPGAAGAAAGAADHDAEPRSYEQAVAELERLVQAMESAQLPLEDILRSYQRGAQLLSYCRGRLEAVEQQVQVLEDGQLRPWLPARDGAG